MIECEMCEKAEYHRIKAETLDEAAKQLLDWAGANFQAGKDAEAQALRGAAWQFSTTANDHMKHSEEWAQPPHEKDRHTCAAHNRLTTKQ